MNSRINEDLAWLRVQDAQREAENRRLMKGPRTPGRMRALVRLTVRSLASAWPRRSATQSVARPPIETRHHA